MSHSRDDLSGTATRDVVDHTHLVGGFYFVDKYRPLWWAMAGVTTLLLPPAGAFVATWMLIACITTDPDDVTMVPE